MEKTRILLVLVFSFFALSLHSQKALHGVAKIEVYDDKGNLLETGSGIVVGSRGSEMFIVTANHVVDKGKSVKVTFHSRVWEQFPARVFDKVNFDLDYTVVIADVPPKLIKTVEFHQPDFDNLKSGDKVKLIGHPSGEDWTINTQNIITNPQVNTYEVAFSNIGVEPGYSGGMLLSNKKNHLIGLIVNVETQNTIAVMTGQILRDLRAWGVPYQYILPYKPPRKASAYVFAVLSAGATGAGLYFNNEKDNLYQTYSDARDPNAPVYNDRSRDATLAKAEDNQQYSYYAFGAAGGMAILSILLSKRKYKQQDERFSFILEQYDPYVGGAKFGIAYKF